MSTTLPPITLKVYSNQSGVFIGNNYSSYALSRSLQKIRDIVVIIFSSVGSFYKINYEKERYTPSDFLPENPPKIRNVKITKIKNPNAFFQKTTAKLQAIFFVFFGAKKRKVNQLVTEACKYGNTEILQFLANQAFDFTKTIPFTAQSIYASDGMYAHKSIPLALCFTYGQIDAIKLLAAQSNNASLPFGQLSLNQIDFCSLSQRETSLSDEENTLFNQYASEIEVVKKINWSTEKPDFLF